MRFYLSYSPVEFFSVTERPLWGDSAHQIGRLVLEVIIGDSSLGGLGL